MLDPNDPEFQHIGKKVKATMNGEKWFDGILINIVDFYASYLVEVNIDGNLEQRYFCHIKLS